MKRFFSIGVLLCSTVTIVILYAKSSGAHPGSTGAPGDKTCADAQTGCHADASVNKGDDVNSLSISELENGLYTPGKTYTLKVSVRDAQAKLFGFQIVALNSSNKSTGKLGVSFADTPKRTQVQSSGGREYITHTTNSITPTKAGSNEWTFVWTAPTNYTGPVHFYYATNATNGNLASTGDKIYLSSLTLNGATTGVEEEQKTELRCTPNPAADALVLTIPEYLVNNDIQVELFDLQGNVVQRFPLQIASASLHLALDSALPSGAYIVQATTNNGILRKKILISH